MTKILEESSKTIPDLRDLLMKAERSEGEIKKKLNTKEMECDKLEKEIDMLKMD